MKIIALQIKIIVLAICFLGASNTATTQTVHAIICGATNVTDIGDGCKVSVNKLENALKYVEQQTKMDVKITRLTGSNFSKPRIVQAINKLKADENDVIMFYSTSHGFNYKDIPSRYAIISAHPTKVEMSRRELVNFGLSLEKEVYQPLLRRGARLTIAMAEACNTVVDIPSPSSYNAININIQKRLKAMIGKSIASKQTSLGADEYLMNYFEQIYNHFGTFHPSVLFSILNLLVQTFSSNDFLSILKGEAKGENSFNFSKSPNLSICRSTAKLQEEHMKSLEIVYFYLHQAMDKDINDFFTISL